MPAQTVTIKGYAPAYSGYQVSAYTSKDYLTNTPVRLASAKVNDSGKFRFSLDGVSNTEYVYLKIDNLNGSMYVSPGNIYHVIFPTPDSTRYQNPYVEHNIDLIFVMKDTDNINNLIMDFNDQFYDFWKKNYIWFVKKEGAPYLDTFYVKMNKRYEKVNNPYFNAYLKYTIAEYQLSILMGQKTLAARYLKNQPILYHHYEYMKFFNDYFNGYLEQVSIGREGKDLGDDIDNNNYPDLMEILRINPMLRANDSMCELVLLKGLYELYYGGNYKKENIKTILHTIQNQSKIEEDRTIAGDMLSSFSGIIKGAAAPDFAMKDEKGNLKSLLDFRGRFLYIGFIKTGSEACLSEMNVMAALNKTYGKKMSFLCISEDQSSEELSKFLNSNKSYNWTFLYDEGANTLDHYGVKVLPEFFLIGPSGKFVMAPADEPSHGIEVMLDKLLEQKK